ncbi:MAG: tyrosine-protein phosphatase [Candidatus Methanomethylophilaceae archaeon]|nr:tyrosine-protein phosphatase [Candidatus Methanomethylophilaceae archaeon]
MGRISKAPVITLVAIVAIIGAIAVSDNFRDHDPTVNAEVIEVIHGNTFVLDIGMDVMEGIGAEIGDDILVKTDDDSFSVLLSPDSKYNGISIYGGYLADVSGRMTLGFSNCNHVTIDIDVGDILTMSREGRNPNVDRIPNYLRGHSDDPGDYDDTIVFGNLREVVGGDLVPGSIYRSASPWNAGNRSPVADDYLREQGVESIICLNMNEDEVAEYADGMPDAYASELFREGKVSCKLLRAAVHSYPGDIVFVIDSLLESDGKTGIFCTQGKDRTGFYCAVIEGLAGATYDEILADFMESFCNYYHIEEGSEEYEVIAKNYPQRVLYLYDHTELIPHPEKVDWDSVEFEKFDPEEVFTKYLVDYIGMDADKVQKVKDKLTGAS